MAEDQRPVYKIGQWLDENRDSFKPPVCNKLMELGQLVVMFVGGPNVRPDYHIEEGEELFYMFKGDMCLKIWEKNVPKDVHIKEGEIFVLPSRIPHSPQRPQAGSIGLVIERKRLDHEIDGLRWYVGDQVLYEETFYCHDLGVQLKPAIERYFASEEYRTQTPQKPQSEIIKLPYSPNSEISVSEPFRLDDWLSAHSSDLSSVGHISLPFGGETRVTAHSDLDTRSDLLSDSETWFWQIKGAATVTIKEGSSFEIPEGSCWILQPSLSYSVTREAGSIGLSVVMKPHA